MGIINIEGAIYDTGEPPVADMLARLCERQRETIHALQRELEHERKTFVESLKTLDDEAQERKKKLAQILADVQAARAGSEKLLKQRDVTVWALRSLCSHLDNQPITSLTYFGGEAFAKAYRQARELLKIADGSGAVNVFDACEKECKALLDALRKVIRTMRLVDGSKIPDRFIAVWSKRLQEAEDLLSLIDQQHTAPPPPPPAA